MLRTKRQRRLCDDCPVARTADLMGDTASLIIVRDLLRGPKRFGELEAALGVSTRTLSLKLAALKKSGLVKPGAAYALTPKGRALRPVLESLRRYGEKYL
jgi:DNA-binding HxlR family transcriptional regulator